MAIIERYHIVIQGEKGTITCNNTQNERAAYVLFHALCNALRRDKHHVSLHEIGRNDDGSGYCKTLCSRNYYLERGKLMSKTIHYTDNIPRNEHVLKE